MFLGLPYSDPLVTGMDPDPSIIKQKTLIPSTVFCDFFLDFLSLKNDVNVPSKSNKKNFSKKLVFSQRQGSADPDPH